MTAFAIVGCKSDNFKESNQEEAKSWYQKLTKKIRVITLQGAIEKMPILLSQYEKTD